MFLRYAFFGLSDHIANDLSGSLQSMNRVMQATRCYLGVNYLFMAPLGAGLAFGLDLGVYGPKQNTTKQTTFTVKTAPANI